MKKLALVVMLVLALGLLPVAGQAAVTYYTNEASFLGVLQPGYYNETFGSIGSGDLGVTSLPFSGNGFSYTLSVGGADTLFGLPNAISTTAADDTMQGSSFASIGKPLVGIGGQFYFTDVVGSDLPGSTLTVSVNGVVTFVSYPALGPRPFFGVIDTAGISSLSVGITDLTGNFVTISDLTVGTIGAVPVPPSALLLGSGLLGVAGWRRFRKS